MPDSPGVTLPLVGKVSRKWLLIVGGGSVASIAYFLWRRKQNAAAAATTDTSSAGTTDTSGGQIDPLTGDIAGSAQDQMDLAALQDESGYGTGLGSGLGDYGGYIASPPAGGTIPGAGGFATNGEWAQQAETDLGGLGINETTLSAALGAYLTGRPLSASQQSMVDQAIAEEGYPPVSGPGGYPPAMKTSPNGGGGGGGGNGSGTVTVPNVVGSTVNQADSKLKSAGLTYNTDTAKDKRGYDREVTGQNPEAGSKVASGTHVGLTWHYVRQTVNPGGPKQ